MISWGNPKLRLVVGVAAAVTVLAAAGEAGAVVVNWADLTSVSVDQSTNTWTVDGTITVGADTVGVTFVGEGLSFVQVNDQGTNYWTQGTPAPYTSGSVSNAPPTTDIIALDQGGLKTITFSKAVSDVYMGLVSWNGNTGTFNQPLTVISQGCGYWGCGTFTNVTSDSFTGDGELHGVIEFAGNFNQVSFTDNTEGWHGFNVGIAGEAPAGVPEPAVWALMIAGFGGAGAMLRRRKAGLASA